MPIEVVILGCNHKVQIDDGDPRLQDARSTFQSLIEHLIQKRGIQLIGEEVQENRTSIAYGIADRRQLRLCPIDVAEDLRGRLHTLDVGIMGVYGWAWNLMRKWYMMQEFIDHLGVADSALLICDRSHLPPMAHELGKRRFRVIPICFRLEGPDEEYDCCTYAQQFTPPQT